MAKHEMGCMSMGMSAKTSWNTDVDSSAGGSNMNAASTHGMTMATNFLFRADTFNLSLSHMMSRHFTKMMSAQ